MKKIAKMINLMLAIIILLSTILPVMCNLSEVIAATYSVEYHGKVTYGLSTVGDFTVNGVRAFCMDHDKSTPPTGTQVTSEVYNDVNVAKCLYYGWGGARQWSGFTSESMGVVMTTLALDHFKNGNTNRTAESFIDYVNSVSMPEIVLNFSNRNLTAYAIEGNMQRTESVTVTGSSEYSMTLNLQSGVTLVNETRGGEYTGNVNVNGGDTFYLKAPLTVNGQWTSGNIDNCKYVFQPIVYRSTTSSYQVLAGELRVQVDPGTTTNISVNWLSTGNLIIHKVDSENTGIKIADTTFDIFNSDNRLVGTITTNAEGIARLDNITIGTYRIVEKKANDYYNVDENSKTVQVNSLDNNVTITNSKKTGYIEINKYDAEDTSKKLENVKFGIYDATNNSQIQILTTNNKGYAKSQKLPLDKQYIVKELETDSNYLLNTTEWRVNLTENGIVDGFTYTLNVGNQHKKGNLVIHKVDKDDHNVKLENIAFKIYDANNNYITTIRTNKDGIARLDNINIGSYKIVESETNQYYRLNTDEKTLNVKHSSVYGDSEITIENEQKVGYIEINKYDKDAKEKYNKTLGVSNVVFGIFDEQGNKIQEITTDQNGYAKSKELSLMKKYVVKELKTRDEYITNNTEFKVNLTQNGIVDGYVYTLNVANEHKKGNLHIEKITKDDHTIQMGNIEFELYLVGNGEINLYIGTYYTDANGEIYIENINTGNYMLKETSTNRWYYLADDTNIEVKWSKEFGDTNVTIENEKKKGIIKIVKVDNDFNNYPLENIKFNVYDEDNNFIETITTNSEGIAESSRLRIDKKYHVVESETLQNYILDETIYDIDFTKGLTKDQIEDIQTDTICTLNLKNKHQKGNLVIHKVDSQDETIPVEGVTFELYVKNVDKPYTKDQLIGTYKTNAEGKIQIDNLWTGEYYLKETETNIWYKLNADITDVEIKYNETTEVTIKNEAKRGFITINKQDSEFTEIKIPGVVFNIYDEDANFVESITTDENGIAQSSLLPIDKTYYVVEVATNDSYILTNEFFKVNFTENMTEDDIANIEADIEYSLTIENDIKRGSLKVIKIDKDNNILPVENVTFDVVDETTNKVIDTVVTNKNGIALIENLRIDRTYSLIEKETNYKYKLNEDAVTNIEIVANEETEVKVENERLKGKLRVIKVDNEDHTILIPNVEFEILDSKMNVIETLTTNENGEAISSDLPAVDEIYYLRESKNAELYELSNEIVEVELTADEITDIVFENEAKKSALQIIKIDTDNNSIYIPKAEFEIYDETTKEIVGTVITDENGKAIIDGLKVTHTYSAKEVKSNYKYKLNDETKTNIVLTPEQITDVTFENEKLKGQVKVIKVDKDNNEVKLEGVEFELLDSEGNVIETLVTDENGEAVSSKWPCVEETYYLKETHTQETYVLSEEIKEIVLTADEITNIVFENEKIKGKLQITKIDSNNADKKLKDAVFGIFDENDNLVQEITTDENGIAISEDLVIGKYYCKELNSGSEYYLLNENSYEFEIKTNGEIVEKTIDNEPVDIEVTVDKTGTVEIKPGEKVDYTFTNVGNNSNVYLENFKWYDYIPTDYIRLEKMTTGTWNQELYYNVYYKTNKSDEYILFKENLSTNENYDLDFTAIQFAEDEYITQTMFDFGKVDTGFKESISPTMQCQSLETLQDGQTFTNHTKTVGVYFGVTAESDSDHTTIVHKPKEEHEPVLPRTGK